MTAPDRILMIEGYLPNDIRWMESRLGEGEEYIRKGAFPVEEVWEEYRRLADYRDWCNAAFADDSAPRQESDLEGLLRRILSILEGDSAEN